MFDKYTAVAKTSHTVRAVGHVDRVEGLYIESLGPPTFVGEQCILKSNNHDKPIPLEVVSVHQDKVILMPYHPAYGIEVGQKIFATGHDLQIPVSDALLGRVIDAQGYPIDGKGGIAANDWRSVIGESPSVLNRKRITEQIRTGIKAIDAFIPVGYGQRLGIFSGSGIGKSTLIGMIARNTEADVNVIALVGERGREVKEFLLNNLGKEGLARSVVVTSISDSPAICRIKAAFTATTIAEYFRDRGKNVMLLFDSVTRFARAQQEVGLSIGEPPSTRGYPPSVFSLLPKLLERCASTEVGTITGFYSILVEGDDIDEPISDAVRGIVDGHVILSRKLAQRNHYPAIDILASLSRLSSEVMNKELHTMVDRLRSGLALYNDAEDLIQVGAYVKGMNEMLDAAIERQPALNEFLHQGVQEQFSLEDIEAALNILSNFEQKSDE